MSPIQREKKSTHLIVFHRELSTVTRAFSIGGEQPNYDWGVGGEIRLLPSEYWAGEFWFMKFEKFLGEGSIESSSVLDLNLWW